ncbi:hypothetical protein [Loktanella sp. Alg231-35]|uniref:hypothetical protein n=1 Tax=Loktanella sp. Alg231-35 TaxID=1922220 RepID=UPI000D54B450|nr:hypothetical protein [Loktanella sp. Alg231-35]
MPKPKIGDIWRYPYLWKREALDGEEAGRKLRPTALAAIVPVSQKSTRLYLLPITGTEPFADQNALKIPATEIRRAGLSEYKRLWVIMDEYNRDELETSFYFEPHAEIGSFSKAFVQVMAGRFAEAIRARKTQEVKRTE